MDLRAELVQCRTYVRKRSGSRPNKLKPSSCWATYSLLLVGSSTLTIKESTVRWRAAACLFRLEHICHSTVFYFEEMILPFGRSFALAGRRTLCRGLPFVGVHVHCPGSGGIQASQRRKSQPSAVENAVLLREQKRRYHQPAAIDDSLVPEHQQQQQQQQHLHSRSSSNNGNDPKRKHFWSLEELRRESDQLEAYCRNGLGLTNNVNLHYVTNTAHIFHLLEAWMEQAKADAQSTSAIRASLSGSEAARAARHVLLNVLDLPSSETTTALHYQTRTQKSVISSSRKRSLPATLTLSCRRMPSVMVVQLLLRKQKLCWIS